MTFYSDRTDITITEVVGIDSKLRADVDNLVKTVLDGLNGAAFEDDRQVVNIKAFKR